MEWPFARPGCYMPRIPANRFLPMPPGLFSAVGSIIRIASGPLPTLMKNAMQKHLMTLTLIAVAIAGTWVVVHRDQINSVNDAWQLARSQFQQVAHQLQSVGSGGNRQRVLEHHNGTLKIASFSISSFSAPFPHNSVLQNPNAQSPNAQSPDTPHPDPVGVIARIASEFDVLAIQRVRSTDPTLMRRLVDRINTQFNAQYDYVLSPEVGAGADKEQFAFVFDRQTVVLDVANRYAIADCRYT